MYGPSKMKCWLFGWVIWSCMIITTAPVTATMYKCFDPTGSMVLTDSPAQLEDCTVLDPTKPTAQISKPAPSKPNRVSRSRQRRQPVTSQRQERQFSQGAEPNEAFQEESKDSSEKNKPEPITIPITKIGGSIVVQVLLNNSVDAHLIVDTGATMTVISYDLGIELGLLSGSDVSLNTVNTAGGSVQVSMTKVGTVQVGAATASNVAVAIHDLPDGISGVSGLLGMSFLRNFEVTLDADRGLLRLLPKVQ